MINALQHNIVDGVWTICHAKFPGAGSNRSAGALDDTVDKGESSVTKVPGGLTSDKSGNFDKTALTIMSLKYQNGQKKDISYILFLL